MGCDIHLHVEKRIGGNWVRAESLQPNPYKGESDEPDLVFENWYTGRNYDLFAILADVRNGRGFAGVITGRGFCPILGSEEPTRGFPADVTESIAKQSEEWNGDWHSRSWLSVRELLTFDWQGQVTEKRAIFDVPQDLGRFANADEWIAWARQRAKSYGPHTTEWCAGISGRDVVVAMASGELRAGGSDRRDRAEGGATTKLVPTHAEIVWDWSYAQAAGESWAHTLVRLARIAVVENLTLDDVRIVFAFDN